MTTEHDMRLRSGSNLWSLASLALVAVLLLGLLIPQSTTGAVLVILAVVLLLFAARASPWSPADLAARRVGLAASSVAIVLGFVNILVSQTYVSVFVAGVTTLLAAVVLVTSVRGTGRHTQVASIYRWGVALLLVAALMALGFTSINDNGEPIDVLDLHRIAAEELARGSNPYLTAVATNTSPLVADGAVFEGYVYPPTTMMSYVVAQWTVGDPRWATVAAATAFVLLLLTPWSAMPIQIVAARSALAAVFVVLPYLGLIINRGWTDLIALPFLLASGRLWRTRPVLSSVLLGLALSTKPYFVLALPLLLLWPGREKWRRVAIVGAIVAASFVPFAIDDVSSVLSVVNTSALTAGYRPKSLGLAGLGVNVPRLVSFVLAVAIGMWAGVRGGHSYRFFVALGAILAVAFGTGFQAFINYWYFVASLAIVAVALSVHPRFDADAEVDGSPRTRR